MVNTVGQQLALQDRADEVLTQIAAILAANLDEQESLYGDDYALDVYESRVNPWERLYQGDDTPLVNVSLGDGQFNGQRSSTVNNQHVEYRYNLDCIGFSGSRETAQGHEPGDYEADRMARRSRALVRQIIMCDQNTYLQARGVVGKRWIESTQMLTPGPGNSPVEHVVAARLVLAVQFIESGPETQGEPLEIAHNVVERQSDGKVLLRAEYQYGSGD